MGIMRIINLRVTVFGESYAWDGRYGNDLCIILQKRGHISVQNVRERTFFCNFAANFKNNWTMTLFDQISEDIKAAMKARDKVRLETLRNIKKVFLEAKTAPGANDTLADADALKIISKLAKQGKETAATYTEAGRQDLAEEELAQVDVLEGYLPKQLSAEEIEAEVKRIIAEVGATSLKEMGKVMGTASKQLAGKADGRVISEVVKKLLA